MIVCVICYPHEGFTSRILLVSCLFIEQQKTDSQHFPSRPFIHRRPGPPTMVPSKNHVSSPLTNQLASINALFNPTQSQSLLQGHSHSTSSTTASGSSSNSNNATRSSLNEISGHSNVGPGNTNNTSTNHCRSERKEMETCCLWFYLADVTEIFLCSQQIHFHSWENLMTTWNRTAISRRRK